MELIKQIMGNSTPEARANIFKQAKQFGVPEDVLTKIQNLK